MNVYRNPNTYKHFLNMATVHKYTIIYFTLIVQESMSSSINRNLCLETVKRFIDYEWECDFGLSDAKEFLRDVTTCPKKCNLQTSHLHNNGNSLGKIDLTIGDEREMLNFCSGSSNFNINCSSWNAREYIIWDDANSCSIKDADCVYLKNYCVCHCLSGYILVDEKCLKNKYSVPGNTRTQNLELNDPCEFTEQCIQPFSVCFKGKCKCINGYSAFDTEICFKGNLQLNDSCELTAQCTQPFSVCFRGTCKCRNGYSKFDADSCMKDTIPVGGFCNVSNQCTGSNNSGICENGRCTCPKEFTVTDLACHPNSLGIECSNSQQHDTNIGVTLGSLFGGFILGVIVSAVATTLMYRRLKLRTGKREEPDVMFADNRTSGGASGAQISYRNNKKRDVAMFSLYSFAKETPGYNLSEKQDERSDDVYNHLHEQTEQVDDTYAHACAVPNHCTDLSEYSNIYDAATFRPSPSKEGDDYSILTH